MTQFKHFHGSPNRATSDCGRAEVRTDAHGEVDGFARLDGRLVVRGNYADMGGVYADHPVADDDWALVVETFGDLRSARDTWRAKLNLEHERRMDAREAAFDGIEQVRGGAYDPNADGYN